MVHDQLCRFRFDIQVNDVLHQLQSSDVQKAAIASSDGIFELF